MVIKDNRKADRAKQFIPFDALKGFKETLRAKEKIKSKINIIFDFSERTVCIC